MIVVRQRVMRVEGRRWCEDHVIMGKGSCDMR